MKWLSVRASCSCGRSGWSCSGSLSGSACRWISRGAPGGILAHQAAGTGRGIDLIQLAWAEAGLLERARYAMYGDIVFITVYGLGSWYGGLHFMQDAAPRVRRLGIMLVASAAIFIATDYAETFSQLIQLTQRQGSDTLAGIAAAVRPFKIAAWLATFLGVIAVFVVRRFSRRAG